ncbi:hypothetical protein [Methylibium sp.]|uniref:hypothetical protein n=1 Tax=Methylibium sp. TaxID=2067992 RepID=UPI0017ACFC9D|nr:hypothetical protein [Methylibium sp.]MBA3591561.1 hypothetical protein [Methylibium sp.]
MSGKSDKEVRDELRRIHRQFTGEQCDDMRTDRPGCSGICTGAVGLVLWVVIVGLLLLLCTGCAKTEREGRTVRRLIEHGEHGGVPFSKTAEETSETSETTTTGVDTQAIAAVVTTAVRAAMAAGTGGLGFGIPEAVAGIATAGAGIAALLQSRKAARKQTEADAAWDAEREAQIKAALMTPPPKGTT